MNDLVASCSSEKCSYNYSSHRTPTIQSISPSQATTGTQLTVNGTGFTNNASHVMVTIGNVECNVDSASETQIKFTVGKCRVCVRSAEWRQRWGNCNGRS